MRFSEIYKNKSPRFSIEIFPPKTPQGVLSLLSELKQLSVIDPAYVSVTYGAMGSTRDLTQDLAIHVHEELGLNTAFHFTCVGSGREDIKRYVDYLHGRGINMVVALRGDRPLDQASFEPPTDGFSHANELVSYLKGLNDFSIAVAGYPEKHPEAIDLNGDIDNLKRKVDAGADVIITQLFFDNALFYRWVEKVRKANIQIPIIAGIMPILKLAQIKRISTMCGATMPIELISQLEKSQDNDAAMIQIGIDHATAQCRDLMKQNVAGIHFYCLNKAHSVLQIAKNCR